jgi:hypothetical protein
MCVFCLVKKSFCTEIVKKDVRVMNFEGVEWIELAQDINR